MFMESNVNKESYEGTVQRADEKEMEIEDENPYLRWFCKISHSSLIKILIHQLFNLTKLRVFSGKGKFDLFYEFSIFINMNRAILFDNTKLWFKNVSTSFNSSQCNHSLISIH